MKLSVIICSHNPRLDYLTRVLDALKGQDLPREQWEFLLVDNASTKPLVSGWDLSWHPNAKFVEEKKLGLAPARLAGIREATASLIVFADDDNVLEPDYLQTAIGISEEYPFLGAWSGRVVPEFETAPPAWIASYLPYLALRDVSRTHWSNLVASFGLLPTGAGLCVRAQVAREYLNNVERDETRAVLGRKGDALSSSEDFDLALTACDLGYGTGVFKELCLTHLIPASRLSPEYLLRIVEETAFSNAVLEARRSPGLKIATSSKLRRFLGRLNRRLTLETHYRRIVEAEMRGRLRAARVIQRERSTAP
jgi:glycosyltransferase involved in cell wall biosynthesis